MDSGELLAGKIVSYFRTDCRLGEEYVGKYLDDPNSIYLADFKFTFNIDKKNLEVLIFPSNSIDSLEKCISWIETRQSLKKDQLKDPLRQNIKKYASFLKYKKFEKLEGKYIFTAEFDSNNFKKAKHSVINYVLRQILSYPRDKTK
ncbi:MAG: hypothetical protein KKF48_00480 [Nanoarchaeota archaeon]|nr:hypothetical protein [Nanoarchaeota archaeon]MBU1027501.1 hypothetical protein [Nanoarchaeota archaeon]